MEFKTFVFYVLGAIMLIAALRTITARNPVHAALYLVLAFFTAAGLWMLLEAEFLAMVLIMVFKPRGLISHREPSIRLHPAGSGGGG